MKASGSRGQIFKRGEQVPSADLVFATLKIYNVTGQSSLGMGKVPLRALCMRTVNCELRPGRLRMRIAKPHSYAQITANGTMMVSSCTEEECHTASRRFARIVQSVGFPVSFRNFRVVNMLGSVDFHFSVDLQALAEAHKEHVSLSSDRNAQQLHYRFKDDPQVENKSITATIFYTGRMNVVGAKSTKELRQAFDILYPIVVRHRFSLRVTNSYVMF